MTFPAIAFVTRISGELQWTCLSILTWGKKCRKFHPRSQFFKNLTINGKKLDLGPKYALSWSKIDHISQGAPRIFFKPVSLCSSANSDIVPVVRSHTRLRKTGSFLKMAVVMWAYVLQISELIRTHTHTHTSASFQTTGLAREWEEADMVFWIVSVSPIENYFLSANL